MVNDNDAHGPSPQLPDHDGQIDTPLRRSRSEERPHIHAHGLVEAPPIRENVRATLSPLPVAQLGGPSSRVSGDSTQSSFDINRRSFDARRSIDVPRSFRRPSHEVRRSISESRDSVHIRSHPGDKSPLSAKPQGSSGSATNSLDPRTESSAAIQSINETNASASQILNRSDVFRRPTIHRSTMSTSEASIDKIGRQSQDTARSANARKVPQKSSGLPHLKHISSQRKGNIISVGAADMDEDSEAQQINARLSGSSSALQDLMGAASYPLQKASGLAGFIKSRSKRMSNLLATESMGYYEKVSGMWAGGRKHYNTAEGLTPDDQVHGLEEDEDATKAAEHFREHFALPDTEQLQSSFFCSLTRIFPTYGKIYVSNHYFCFRSLMPGSKTKVELHRSCRCMNLRLTAPR